MFNVGQFGWHDFNTHELEQARAFYTGLFGWHCGEPAENGYRLLTDKGKGFGWFFPMSQEMEAASHWSGYLMVEDIDVFLERATELGGTVPFDAMTIPDAGRFGVVFDPTGAMASVFQPSVDDGETGTGGAGETVIWNELVTTDVPAAAAFFSDLLGWSFRPEVVAGGGYALARLNGEPVAGIFDSGVRPSPSAWLTYFRTGDIAVTISRAVELGATIIHPATQIGSMGIVTAWLNDPSGATFGLMQAEDDWFDRLRRNG